MIDSLEISGSDGLLEVSVKTKAIGVFAKTNLDADAAIGSPATVTVQDSRGLQAGDLIKVVDSTGTENTTVDSVTNKTTLSSDLTAAHTVANGAHVELRPQTPTFIDPALPFSFVHLNLREGADLTAAAAAAETNIENWTFAWSNGVEERFGSLGATPSVVAPK